MMAKKKLKKKLHEFCHYTRVIKAAFFDVIADENSACSVILFMLPWIGNTKKITTPHPNEQQKAKNE